MAPQSRDTYVAAEARHRMLRCSEWRRGVGTAGLVPSARRHAARERGWKEGSQSRRPTRLLPHAVARGRHGRPQAKSAKAKGQVENRLDCSGRGWSGSCDKTVASVS